MIENTLKSLGFDEDDTKTYLLLLKTGSLTAGKLAKNMGVPRSSLYGYLKRLTDHGLINESLKSGIKIFTAEPPEKVTLLFSKKIDELEKNKQDYLKLLPLLPKQSEKMAAPKLQIFEGTEGLRQALKDMLLYYDIETQAFWPQKKMVEVLGSDFFWYLNKERIKNRLHTRAIWPTTQLVDIKQHPYFGVGEKFLREIRLAPKTVDFQMGYWIYGRKTVFISSQKESFGFVIESQELAQTLKTQFEMIWQISSPLKIDPKDTGQYLKEIGIS